MNPIIKNRLILIGIIMLFVTPIIASWYLVFFTDYQRNNQGVHHGMLVDPVIKVGDIEVKTLEDDSLTQVGTRWTWVFFVEDRCDDDCSKKLYKARQLRLALGKEIDKIDRLLVTKSKIDWSPFSEAYAGQKILESDMQDYEVLMNAFGSHKQFNPNSIYLMDPYGFLMMQYSADAEPKGMIRDLERLIRNAR